MKVLVVEDEKRIARFICKGLSENGFNVTACHRGDEVEAMLAATPYDAMLLDVMLPGRDGLSILRRMRERKITLPVLILTARSETSEKIEGLNAGADDYLAKPFALDELIARLHALLRRSCGTGSSTYRVGDLTIHLLTREATRGTRKIDLTPREFAFLEYFMRSPGKVFTRTQICEHVWDYHFDPGTNLVDVYVKRLRQKVDVGEEIKLIQTIRGVGYMIEAP